MTPLAMSTSAASPWAEAILGSAACIQPRANYQPPNKQMLLAWPPLTDESCDRLSKPGNRISQACTAQAGVRRCLCV